MKVDVMRILTEAEALDWLMVTAMQVPANQACVELGVYQGGSLHFIGFGAKLGCGAAVYGIDPFGHPKAYGGRPGAGQRRRYTPDNYELARRNVGNNANIIRGFSVEVAARWNISPVGLLYIDAEHTYEAVRADIEAWRPHLTDGAWVAFDDFEPRFPGLMKAVREEYPDHRVVGSRLAVARHETNKES